MTDRPTDERRQALVAAAGAGALEPHAVAELELLADVLADISTWAEPDVALEDAVVRAVVDAAGAIATSLPSTDAGTSQQTVLRWRRLLAVALVAAVVVAIAVASVLVTRGATDPNYAARLEATGLAPDAHASAEITRQAAGFRITLEADGLPSLPAGEFYQAWLKHPTGTLVPIGTFSSDDGPVTLWSSVSPADFPTITVTIEATDDVQGSSGRRVLVGDLRATGPSEQP
jgi:hypothetical protein